MRLQFTEMLREEMLKDERIYLLTGDLGYPFINKILNEFPERAINVGADEFNMVSYGIGLSLEGKIPVTYTISPFYYRAFELLRTYVNFENIPIKMIATGKMQEYEHDGYSHHFLEDDVNRFKSFENIKVWEPNRKEFITGFKDFLYNDTPTFALISRFNDVSHE